MALIVVLIIIIGTLYGLWRVSDWQSRKRLVQFIGGVLAVQYVIAFAWPHLTKGDQFCWVQARRDEESPYRDVRYPYYDLRAFDSYFDVSSQVSFDINFNNGSSPTEHVTMIYFGYTDGRKLYAWSPRRFSYYQVPEYLILTGLSSALETCRERLGDTRPVRRPSGWSPPILYIHGVAFDYLTNKASTLAFFVLGAVWVCGFLSWRMTTLGVVAIPVLLAAADYASGWWIS